MYQTFIEEGSLTLVDELPDDLEAVVAIVSRVKKAGLLARVGVDAIGLGGIVDGLAEIGVTQEAHLIEGTRQGISLMGAIKTIERKLVRSSTVGLGDIGESAQPLRGRLWFSAIV